MCFSHSFFLHSIATKQTSRGSDNNIMKRVWKYQIKRNVKFCLLVSLCKIQGLSSWTVSSKADDPTKGPCTSCTGHCWSPLPLPPPPPQLVSSIKRLCTCQIPLLARLLQCKYSSAPPPRQSITSVCLGNGGSDNIAFTKNGFGLLECWINLLASGWWSFFTVFFCAFDMLKFRFPKTWLEGLGGFSKFNLSL